MHMQNRSLCRFNFTSLIAVAPKKIPSFLELHKTPKQAF